MIPALNRFANAFTDLNNMRVIHDHMKYVIKSPQDCSDLLRWEWVQSVSALDKFIHDIVLAGMIETFLKKRPPTAAYLKFPITIEDYLQIMDAHTSSESVFANYIISKHGYLSFQDPAKIKEALSLFWNEDHKWQKISTKIFMDEKDAITKLKLIVLRRNQIAHEGDIHTATGEKQDIDKQDVDDVRSFIYRIGNAIYCLCKL